eukprot:g71681.t1
MEEGEIADDREEGELTASDDSEDDDEWIVDAASRIGEEKKQEEKKPVPPTEHVSQPPKKRQRTNDFREKSRSNRTVKTADSDEDEELSSWMETPVTAPRPKAVQTSLPTRIVDNDGRPLTMLQKVMLPAWRPEPAKPEPVVRPMSSQLSLVRPPPPQPPRASSDPLADFGRGMVMGRLGQAPPLPSNAYMHVPMEPLDPTQVDDELDMDLSDDDQQPVENEAERETPSTGILFVKPEPAPVIQDSGPVIQDSGPVVPVQASNHQAEDAAAQEARLEEARLEEMRLELLRSLAASRKRQGNKNKSAPSALSTEPAAVPLVKAEQPTPPIAAVPIPPERSLPAVARSISADPRIARRASRDASAVKSQPEPPPAAKAEKPGEGVATSSTTASRIVQTENSGRPVQPVVVTPTQAKPQATTLRQSKQEREELLEALKEQVKKKGQEVKAAATTAVPAVSSTVSKPSEPAQPPPRPLPVAPASAVSANNDRRADAFEFLSRLHLPTTPSAPSSLVINVSSSEEESEDASESDESAGPPSSSSSFSSSSSSYPPFRASKRPPPVVRSTAEFQAELDRLKLLIEKKEASKRIAADEAKALPAKRRVSYTEITSSKAEAAAVVPRPITTKAAAALEAKAVEPIKRSKSRSNESKAAVVKGKLLELQKLQASMRNARRTVDQLRLRSEALKTELAQVEAKLSTALQEAATFTSDIAALKMELSALTANPGAVTANNNPPLRGAQSSSEQENHDPEAFDADLDKLLSVSVPPHSAQTKLKQQKLELLQHEQRLLSARKTRSLALLLSRPANMAKSLAEVNTKRNEITKRMLILQRRRAQHALTQKLAVPGEKAAILELSEGMKNALRGRMVLLRKTFASLAQHAAKGQPKPIALTTKRMSARQRRKILRENRARDFLAKRLVLVERMKHRTLHRTADKDEAQLRQQAVNVEEAEQALAVKATESEARVARQTLAALVGLFDPSKGIVLGFSPDELSAKITAIPEEEATETVVQIHYLHQIPQIFDVLALPAEEFPLLPRGGKANADMASLLLATEETRSLAHTTRRSLAHATYESPLVAFRAYRLRPGRRGAAVKLESMTYTNKLNPHGVWCKFDLTGMCNDESCPFQHLRDMTPSQQDVIQEVKSYLPSSSPSPPSLSGPPSLSFAPLPSPPTASASSSSSSSSSFSSSSSSSSSVPPDANTTTATTNSSTTSSTTTTTTPTPTPNPPNPTPPNSTATSSSTTTAPNLTTSTSTIALTSSSTGYETTIRQIWSNLPQHFSDIPTLALQKLKNSRKQGNSAAARGSRVLARRLLEKEKSHTSSQRVRKPKKEQPTFPDTNNNNNSEAIPMDTTDTAKTSTTHDSGSLEPDLAFGKYENPAETDAAGDEAEGSTEEESDSSESEDSDKEREEAQGDATVSMDSESAAGLKRYYGSEKESATTLAGVPVNQQTQLEAWIEHKVLAGRTTNRGDPSSEANLDAILRDLEEAVEKFPHQELVWLVYLRFLSRRASQSLLQKMVTHAVEYNPYSIRLLLEHIRCKDSYPKAIEACRAGLTSLVACPQYGSSPELSDAVVTLLTRWAELILEAGYPRKEACKVFQLWFDDKLVPSPTLTAEKAAEKGDKSAESSALSIPRQMHQAAQFQLWVSYFHLICFRTLPALTSAAANFSGFYAQPHELEHFLTCVHWIRGVTGLTTSLPQTWIDWARRLLQRMEAWFLQPKLPYLRLYQQQDGAPELPEADKDKDKDSEQNLPVSVLRSLNLIWNLWYLLELDYGNLALARISRYLLELDYGNLALAHYGNLALARVPSPKLLLQLQSYLPEYFVSPLALALQPEVPDLSKSPPASHFATVFWQAVSTFPQEARLWFLWAQCFLLGTMHLEGKLPADFTSAPGLAFQILCGLARLLSGRTEELTSAAEEGKLALEELEQVLKADRSEQQEVWRRDIAYLWLSRALLTHLVYGPEAAGVVYQEALGAVGHFKDRALIWRCCLVFWSWTSRAQSSAREQVSEKAVHCLADLASGARSHSKLQRVAAMDKTALQANCERRKTFNQVLALLLHASNSDASQKGLQEFILEQAQDLDPDNVPLNFIRAHRLLQDSQYSRARRCLSRVASAFPILPSVWRVVASMDLCRGRIQASRLSLELGVVHNPTSRALLLDWIWLEKEYGEKEQVEVIVRTAQEREINLPKSLLSIVGQNGEVHAGARSESEKSLG